MQYLSADTATLTSANHSVGVDNRFYTELPEEIRRTGTTAVVHSKKELSELTKFGLNIGKLGQHCD